MMDKEYLLKNFFKWNKKLEEFEKSKNINRLYIETCTNCVTMINFYKEKLYNIGVTDYEMMRYCINPEACLKVLNE